MLTKNNTSSDLTRKRQTRMQYANFIIQEQALSQGCLTRVQLQGGSAGANQASDWTDVKVGQRFTTLEEQVRILASGACPVIVSIPAPIPGPTIDYSSILAFSRSLYPTLSPTSTPTTGSALSINDELVGNYDYVFKNTDTTIASFSDADWFTSTEDTASAWIFIQGNLTLNAAQTFIPTKRKLFTVVYVTGNLVINGTFSMTARGANHSGTGDSGGLTAPVDIRLGTGTFGAVTNPQIPATGGTGGAARATDGGNNGINGTAGGSGGGGSGQRFSSGTAGAGADGTCFSGGGGGGGVIGPGATAGNAVANGGRGGAAAGAVSAGGTGNPGGTGTGAPNGPDGNVGTGGTLILICEGALSGSGTCEAKGVDGAKASGQIGGGASGGGSVNVFYGTNPASAVTVSATGGVGNQSGSGGNGTARKLALV